MKLNNVRQIRAEDFEKDLQQPMGQLGSIVNAFMQEVVEMTDGRIDFENRVEVLKDVDMTFDSNGTPTLNNKINGGKTGIRGIQVIRAVNLTKTTTYASGQPYMSFTPLAGGFIQVNNITNLTPNDKWRLTIIIY